MRFRGLGSSDVSLDDLRNRPPRPVTWRRSRHRGLGIDIWLRVASQLAEVDMLTSRPQDGLNSQQYVRTPEPSVRTACGFRLVLLVGVHLCGMLSIHAARLFRQANSERIREGGFGRQWQVPGPAAFVLAPCCLDKRLPGFPCDELV